MKPWQTPEKKNVAKRFFMADSDIFDNRVFQKLKPSARLIYLWLIGYSCGQQEFKCSYSQAENAGFKEKTFSEALKQLQALGFIKVISGKRKMEVNTIRFISDWKNESEDEPEDEPTKGKPRGKPFPQKTLTANFADAP